MAEDILLNVYNGDQYIELHPITKPSNVINEEGVTMSQIIATMSNQISTLTTLVNNISNPFSMELYSNITKLEKGIAIDSIEFTWVYNKTPFLQKFEGIELDVSQRSYTYSNTIDTTKTFILSAVPFDGAVEQNDSVTVQFLNGVYYGVSESTIYDENLISSLTKTLSDNKSRSLTLNPGSNEYIYYCIPDRLGEVIFRVDGFEGGFEVMATIPFSNINGYTENYKIYRSDNHSLGGLTVEIL